jgi:hypothetical protein
VADESEKKIIPASEILEKIQNGVPVEYDNVIIDGDLDLTKLNLKTQQVERTKHEIKYLERILKNLFNSKIYIL